MLSSERLGITMSALMIFDGVCNLCSSSVEFILKHEAKPELQFASVQSVLGSSKLRELGFDPANVKTFVVVENERAFVRSEAAIRVTCYLRWPWRWLSIVRIVPRPIRDRAYDLVANNRYRWFGRMNNCMVPAPEWKHRFLE